MTKENILRHLNLILVTDTNTLKGFINGHEALEEEIEALKEAIKFIEQEPSEDTISRQAAQNKIKEICNKYRLSYEDGERKPATGGSAYALGHAFDDIPPVTPQPKTGHWIIIDDCEKFIAKCSECGQIEDSRMINKYPYCHCGAKMEGEKV